MNFKKGLARRRSAVGVDLTPLIDVVFNLLIFLLISTTFKNQEQAFSIVLPKGDQPAQVAKAKRATVFVTRDGKYVFYAPEPGSDLQFGQEFLSLDGLGAAINRYVEKEGVEKSISIKADAETDYQAIIDVVNQARGSGVERVFFPYRKSESP